MVRSRNGTIDMLKGKVDIRNRIIATFIILAIACVLLYLSSWKPWLDWVSDVGCGLIVIGAAGIWVSYFVERQAILSLQENVGDLTKGIDARFSVLKTIVEAKIEGLYYHPVNSRDIDRYRRDLLEELDRARNEIRILAVAAREFLFRGEGFAAGVLESILNPKSKKYDKSASLKLLLLHPCSEQAVSRGLREHPDCEFDSFEDTNLWQDVKKSCITVFDWRKKKYNVEARLYKVSPSCFLVFVNDFLFAEFYHFGAGGRASGKVPLMKISATSELYQELKGHFDYVWYTAKCFVLDDVLLEKIKEPGAAKEQGFVQNVMFSRQDLFETKPNNGCNGMTSAGRPEANNKPNA